MAEPPRDLSSILAALKANTPQNATPPQGQPGFPVPGYPAPAQPGYPGAAAQPHPYQSPPAYGYPQPTASGSYSLNAPPQPGAAPAGVSIQEAIARAKAHAAQNGVTPYDRPINYSTNQPRPVETGRYQTSRSRSPPARRDAAFRDNYNPYRDERREDRPQQGRDFDRDRDRSFSPRGRDRRSGPYSPRGGNGSGRHRSPMRGDDNSEIMDIESSLVGLIIGRQGENMRRVEQDSQCRVQFLSATNPNDQFRQCKITGPPARRAEARAAINRIIDDNGMGPIARGAGAYAGGRDGGRGGPAGGPALKEGEDATQIMVPDRTVGLIIGRGGETIRDLQERSGCHINIVGESKSINGLRPVNLIGSPQASKLAKDLIMEIVDSDSKNGGGGGGGGGGGNQHHGQPRDDRGGHGGHGGHGGYGGGGGDKINDSIHVPSEAVGMIIGKGGETIREMQNNTGCKINVSQSSGPGETEREIGLVGSREAIEAAKSAIEDKVEAVRQKNGGGGGGGRGGRGPRDYDNQSYGSQQHSNQNQQGYNAPPAQQPAAAGAAGAADPYAAYGGYQNYLALWYQHLAQQQASGQGGDATKPPGTS